MNKKQVNQLMYELNDRASMALYNAKYTNDHEDFCNPEIIEYDVVAHVLLMCKLLVQWMQYK